LVAGHCLDAFNALCQSFLILDSHITLELLEKAQEFAGLQSVVDLGTVEAEEYLRERELGQVGQLTILVGDLSRFLA